MRALRQSQWFLALLCVLLIGARISGAHWHLCFDRTEAPLSMHIGDIDLHDGGSATDGLHQDTDLKLVDSGLIKSMSGGWSGAMLFAVFACLWLLPLRTRSVLYSRYRLPSFPNDPRPLHAPPRAPPF
jgi:hypothetical protein